MKSGRISVFVCAIALLWTAAWPQTLAQKEAVAGSAERKAAAYFDSIRNEINGIADEKLEITYRQSKPRFAILIKGHGNAQRSDR